jgi:hypothetical protein
MIISKQDGSVVREIEIPFEEKILTVVIKKLENNMTQVGSPGFECNMIPYPGGWILEEPSADTLYNYAPDHTMRPLIVRTPSVQSMDPPVFFFLNALTDRYYFMTTILKEWDFAAGDGFPTTYLAYDKQEEAISRYKIYNDDFSDNRQVFFRSNPVNDEIITWQSMDAGRLIEDYGKGKLKGRLAEIAAGMDEEDNPVIMLAKYKK